MVSKFLLIIIPILIIFIMFSMIEDQPQISQCQSSEVSESLVSQNEIYNSVLITTANSMGKLPTLDSSTIQTFEQYKTFADTMNDGIMILNSELYEIPLLEGTQDEYDKVSKIIIKYTPMVDSYNEMIYASRNVDVEDQNTITCFYTRTAIFSLELTLISTAVYAGPSYKLVGDAYRASGLQTIAFKCGSCVATALSNAHWFVRNTFVETTSVIIIVGFNEFDKFIQENTPVT